MQFLSKFSSLFLRWAQISFDSPELSWVPKDFRQAEPFQKYPLKKVIKKFEEFGLTDFRKEVKTSYREESAMNLIDALVGNLSQLIGIVGDLADEASSVKPGEDSEAAEKLYSTLFHLRNYLIEIKVLLESKKESFFVNGTLKLPVNFVPPKELGWKSFPAGASLLKVYLKLLEKIRENAGVNIDQFALEKMSEWRNYLAAAKSNSLFVVFSTQINDLIGIGARGIRSCQSLFCGNEQSVNFDENTKRIVGTVLSRYTGVIYLTTGADFLGRGERMLARCMVRLIYSLKEEKFYLFLDKMYPKENEEYRRLFVSALKERTDLTITPDEKQFSSFQGFDPEMDNSPNELIHPIGDEDIPEEFRSYLDTEFNDSINSLYDDLESTNYSKRKDAILNLPIEDIEKYLFDSDGRIVATVISRLPEDKLVPELASHPSYQVRSALAKRVGSKHPELFFQEKEIAVIRDLSESLSDDQKIELFSFAIKNKNLASEEFISVLSKYLPEDFVFQHLTDDSFSQEYLSNLLYNHITYNANLARKMLLVIINDGRADLASSLLEEYLEDEYDIYHLQNLFHKFPNQALISLLNASLNKTVWEIFSRGLSVRRFAEFFALLSSEEAKQILRLDDLYDYYFPKFVSEGYPGKAEKIRLLKEKLNL